MRLDILIVMAAGIVLAGLLVGAAGWFLVGHSGDMLDEDTVFVEQLSRRANELLLTADEAIREGELSIDFGRSEFADEDLTPLRETLEEARGELAAAFASRQQVSESAANAELDKRQLLMDAATGAQRAIQKVAAGRRHLEDLRDLEVNAERTLARIPAEIAEIEARLSPTETALVRLRRFADSNWHAVAGNTSEARARLASAREQLDAGRRANAVRDRRTAGHRARTASEDLTQAAALLEAIERTESSLNSMEAALKEQSAAVDREIAAARSSIVEGRAHRVSGKLAEAEAALKQARALASEIRPDVVVAARLTVEASQAAGLVLASAYESNLNEMPEARLLGLAFRDAEFRLARLRHNSPPPSEDMSHGARAAGDDEALADAPLGDVALQQDIGFGARVRISFGWGSRGRKPG